MLSQVLKGVAYAWEETEAWSTLQLKRRLPGS